jgi:hypothetical protein
MQAQIRAREDENAGFDRFADARDLPAEARSSAGRAWPPSTSKVRRRKLSAVRIRFYQVK